MVIEELEGLVIKWAEKRDIFKTSDPKTMCLKTVSEIGELADNIAKGKDVRDDIGDVLVTLIVLSRMCGTTPRECLAIAYNEIKDRTGTMVNGTFVKD